jgi:tRNA dimethylallyltransferase
MAKHSSRITVPVLLGPTAGGKTALALEIAAAAGWEIISCDSRQIYRFLNIGTAKPLDEERRRVRHWLVDILDPSERYSLFAFAHDAAALLRDGARQGKTYLVCGGTGLYFESLRKGIGPHVSSDPQVIETLTLRAGSEGSAALYRELRERDPEAAAKIHENDVQRIVRALAVYYQTGQKISALNRRTSPPGDLAFRIAVIIPPRALLYERINRRVDAMVRRGLWEEFTSVRRQGYDVTAPGLQGVGYQELFAVERGECTIETAIETIKRNSRRYAKRQITWFKTHNSESIVEYSENFEALKRSVVTALEAGEEKSSLCNGLLAAAEP